MVNWYAADERWEMVYGIKTREAYAEANVIGGHFHTGVPKDIQEAWETVEYLLAHAYYFWPMYDEGFNKALRILEIAVLQKIDALEIDNYALSKNEKKRKKTLCQLIEDIGKVPHLAFLKSKLHRGRRIRNMLVHADRNSFMGAMGSAVKNLRFLINLFNTLFLEEAILKQIHLDQAQIDQGLSTFQAPFYVLQYEQKILVKGILHQRVVFTSGAAQWLIAFEPIILNPAEDLAAHRYTPPLVFALQDAAIDPKGLTGIDVRSGEVVRLYVSDKEQDQQTFEAFETEMQTVSAQDLGMYTHYLNANSLWAMVDAEYELWKAGLCL